MNHGNSNHDRQLFSSTTVLKAGKSTTQTSTTNSSANAPPVKTTHKIQKEFSNETIKKQESNKTNYKSIDALDSPSSIAGTGNKYESNNKTIVTISLLPSLPPTSQIRNQQHDNKQPSRLFPNIDSTASTRTMTSSQPTMLNAANVINSLANDMSKSSTSSNYAINMDAGKAVLDVGKLRKSFNFNINQALDYTCNNLALDASANQYCGKCNSCQIINHLNNLKQWFDRASHITLKKFLLGLINRINNLRLLNYLNDLLSPLTECKDFVYARNKFLPSCEEDHSKPTNNRCLDEAYVSKQIESIWQWYSKANYFIKLNFILSVLNKCEQAVVFLVIIKIKSILEAYAANAANAARQKGNNLKEFGRKDANAPKFTYFDAARKTATKNYQSNKSLENFLLDTDESDEEELVFDAFDAEEDDEDELDLLNNEDYEEYEKDYFNSNGLSALESSRKSHISSSKPGNTSVAKSSSLRKKQQKFGPISRENMKAVDFIKQLPIHLSKSILALLDKKSLYSCLFVCKYWSSLIREVHKQSFMHKILLDDMMFLRGTSSKGCNPKYANNVDVKVPNLRQGSYEVLRNPSGPPEVTKLFKSESNWSDAYAGFLTRNVIMEERNVFCGSYNVLLLKEKRDPHRVIHLNGSNTVAYGSFDKKIRFIDLKSAAERPMTIKGHAGSIKSIYILESKRMVFTGSYDTSVRCWSIDTGKCLKIYQGHQGTVNCISMYDEHERMITGSMDRTCRVWNIHKKKPWRTFKHPYAITAVAIGEEICITGGQNGRIKVFHLISGKLIKTVSAHQGSINSIKFDRWHILSCSSDCYALAYSTQGKHKKCLIAMRHPKEVLCLEFQYLRAITGSADGKIRIWNILNGDCIRVMRGNSQCDPVLSMNIIDNRILINTEFNVILMEFENIKFDYNSDYNSVESMGGNLDEFDDDSEDFMHQQHLLAQKKGSNKPYSSIRASRMELVSTPNVKLFTDDRKSALDHSSRPISAKCLKDAKKIHTVVSKSQTAVVMAKNSAGDLSELGLQKRQQLMQSISKNLNTFNALTNQYSSSNNPVNNTLNAFNKPQETNREAAYSSGNDYETLNYEDLDNGSGRGLASSLNRKHKSISLEETKVILRDQLKELKQAQQETQYINVEKGLVGDAAMGIHAEIRENENDKARKKSIGDSKSCIEAVTGAKKKLNLLIAKENETRPSSSPSRVDTRTKVKLSPAELDQVIGTTHFTQPTNNSQLDQYSKMGPASNNDTFNIKQLYDDSGSFNNSTSQPTKIGIYQLTQQVTKVFVETKPKIENKTDKNMYPLNVSSRIPNQKIVSIVTTPRKTPATARANSSNYYDVADTKSFVSSNYYDRLTVNQETKSIISTGLSTPALKKPAHKAGEAFSESTSTFVSQKPEVKRRLIKSESVKVRPVTANMMVPKKPPRTANPVVSSTSNLENGSKLLGSDHLNLMTYKQVDKMIDQIKGVESKGSTDPNQSEEAIYKKFWLLKSKGQYHGSLLAKHKTVAPELRE